MAIFRTKFETKEILKQVTLVCLTFAMTIVIIEGALRLMYRSNATDELLIKDQNGLMVMRPNVDKLILGGADVPIHVKTNAEGFASSQHALTAPTGTLRIAFLGNSFTKGFEVDYDKKFTSLVESALRKKLTNKNVEVMNFAQGGLSVPEQLILYREYVRKYRPDMVVLVVYAGYDFPSVQRFLSEKDYFLTTPLDDLSATRLGSAQAEFTEAEQSWRSMVVEHSEIVRFLIRQVRQSQPLYNAAIAVGLLHQPLTPDVGNYLGELWSYMDTTSAPHRSIMNFTTDLAVRLGTDVERDSGRFMVVLIPSHWQVDHKYRTDVLARHPGYDPFLPNKIITESVSERFPIFDLSPMIEQAINRNSVQIFVHDVGHLTATGHELAAKHLSEFLEVNVPGSQL